MATLFQRRGVSTREGKNRDMAAANLEYDSGGLIEYDNEPVEMGFRGVAGPTPGVDGSAPTDISQYGGTLICLEGTDGVGRSTHIAMLREFLENRGYAVTLSELTRGGLAKSGLRRAKEGHTMGPLTMDLFYATDLADRLAEHILPSLRAGFVVLTDRFLHSAMARSIVRGSDAEWIVDVYRFAPQPHATFYLDATIEDLVPRVLGNGSLDYWESGLDFQEEREAYTSFVRYQTRLLEVYGRMADELGWTRINASRSEAETFKSLREGVEAVLASRKR